MQLSKLIIDLLKARREEKSLSRSDLARALDVTPQTISYIETNYSITLPMLEKYLDALGIDIYELLEVKNTNVEFLKNIAESLNVKIEIK